MATGYTRQSSGLIVTGATIQASHFNNEFDQMAAAMHAVTGHSHDGTAGGGAPLAPTSIGLNTNGIAVRTSSTAMTGRTLTAPAEGLTITNGDGVSGNPTFALANDLAALEGLATSGLAARTGVDTWSVRTITAPAEGITVTNGDGASGNPTLALANDLSALEGLTGTGLAARSAADTWVNRTITGPAAGISVTNGDGVGGDPTLALANDLAAVEGLTGTGLAVRTTTDTWVNRVLTGTSNVIVVTNGDGVGGDPTFTVGSLVARTDTAGNYTAQQNFGTATLTDGASISWDLSTQQVAKVTLGGNRTLAAPTNMVDGGTYVLRVIQDGTGSRTLSYNTVFKWPGGTAPVLSTTAGAVDIITFVSDGTNMYGSAQKGFA